jgi:uncharacterized surface protein with fasciclin (FAS1) repeats
MRRTGLLVVAMLALTACSPDDQPSSNPSLSYPVPPPALPVTMPPGPGPSIPFAAGGVFGPQCGRLSPSVLGAMVVAPVVDALALDPALTKFPALVNASGEAGTLDDRPALTVFAPADPAVDALGTAKYVQLADDPARLDALVGYHVLGARHDAKQLEALGSAGTLDDSGGPLRFSGTGDDLTVNGAKVLCGNIQAKNATVFVIDTVLTPGTNR